MPKAQCLASCPVVLALKNFPRHPVILFPVRFEEGGYVFHGAFCWSSGQSVVHEGFTDGAFLQVLDVFPAEGDVVFFAVGGGDAVEDVVVQVRGAGFAGQTDADEAFAGGKDDAAGLVVPGVGFVLPHDGELDSVDGEQFFQRESEGLGDEDVDFYQGLAAGVVGAQGVVALPLGGEVGEKVLRQRGDGFAFSPVLLAEVVLPIGLPEVGVVACNAREQQNTQI